MKKNITEWISAIIAGVLTVYIFGIIVQVLPPYRVFGVYFDKNKQNEVCISKIIKDTPAEKAGLKLKDCVISVDNKTVKTKGHLYVVFISGKPNTDVNIEIKRDNQILKYKMTRTKKKIDWLFFLKKRKLIDVLWP